MGVKIVRQQDVLAGVALWHTAETHPRGWKTEEKDGGYWLARFAVCPADFHFMARESQNPLGVYNLLSLPYHPHPTPSDPPSCCPNLIILLVSLDAVPGLQRSIHVGILSQPDCCYTVPSDTHPNLLLNTTHHILIPPQTLWDHHLPPWHAVVLRFPAAMPQCDCAHHDLSLCTEAPQCGGPDGYFPMNERRCQLSFTHFI